MGRTIITLLLSAWRVTIIRTLLAVSLLVSLSTPALAKPVTLVWDPNSEVDLAGYRIYIGPSSGNYTRTIDLGHVTSATLSDLTPGETYFIAVTAYNIFSKESDYSVEIQVIIPEPLLLSSGSSPTAGTARAGILSQSGETSPQPTTSTRDSRFPAPTVPLPETTGLQARPEVTHPAPGTRSPSSGPHVSGERSADARSDGGSSSTGGGSGSAPAEGVLQKLLAAIGLQSTGQRDAKAASLYEEGRALVAEGKFQYAILRYQDAERLWEGLNATGDVALAAEGLGTAYYGAEQYLEALNAYDRALRLSRELKNREQEARILENIGATYEALGQHGTAIERYRASLEIWQALGREDKMAAVLERLGAAQAEAVR